MNSELLSGMCVVREVVGPAEAATAPKRLPAATLSTGIPAGYVIRKAESGPPPAKPAETPADVAAHVARRLEVLEKLGLHAGIVRTARSMAREHAQGRTVAEADAQLDELLLLLKRTADAVASEQRAARFAAISG